MTACLILSFAISIASSSGSEGLREARQQFLEGKYDEAESAYRKLSKDDSTRVDAHVGWTDVDDVRGRYREAIERLRGIESDGAKSSDWHTVLAAMLSRVGDYDEAIEHWKRALELSEGNFRARAELGQLYEELGRRQEAIDTYARFDKVAHDTLPDRAEDLMWTGRGFYRYSVLTRNENLKDRCKYVLQDVYQEAFEFVDARYWPARQAAAELLLEKHNTAEAAEDFKTILKSNPKAVEAHAGLAAAAVENWDFDRAEAEANAALEINPNSVAALMALGHTRMLERKFAAAEEVAERILRVNPRSIEGLALLAAAQIRGEKPDAAAATEKRLAAIAPKSAALHFELGFWLSAARQYAEAEREFQKAIEADPTWPEPRTELGLMYMQSGDEPGARRILEASWNLDSFNQQTFNVLELLDQIERFAVHETPHFAIKYDQKQDAVLAPYFAERLAKIYDDVTKEFQAVPTTQTAIEVFPAHSEFSVRISGRPWIHTMGACTGPVIAMDAPRKTGAMSLFNWERVLRHEFTHTVTLAATENRIPHWMTEGMAVYAEHAPRPWAWNILLADAIRRDELFTLQTLDWGFMRPRKATDRSMAYAQSEWQIEYIASRWGKDKLVALLKAFRDRKTQPEAFQSVLGISTADFDRDFSAWAKKEAVTWNLRMERPGDVARLRKMVKVAPFDSGVRARLAEALMLAHDVGPAREQAAKALEIDSEEPRAVYVMATIGANSADQAREDEERLEMYESAAASIEQFLDIAPNDPDAVRFAAMMHQAREEWDEAEELWKKYQVLRPADPDGYRRLAGIYLVTKREDVGREQLEKLYPLTEDEPDVCKRLAGCERARGDDRKAAEWLERAIDIDPYDGETHRELGELYEKLGRESEAERHYHSMTLLPQDEAEGHRLLAAYYRKYGKPDEAARHERLSTPASAPATTEQSDE